MCGRFTLFASPETIQAEFDLPAVPVNLAPRYNIAPTQAVAVIANHTERRLELFQWGLIPSWAKDPSIGSRMINARAETLAEKPSFRTALRKRRCLILADGFYEWRKDGGGKTPFFIHLRSGRPFALAGLWEVWQTPDGVALPTCTIITTGPNNLVAALHDRMPVILPPDAYERWLDPEPQAPADLAPLLVSYPADAMNLYAVSRAVNSPTNDSPVCIEPV
jgi:putative SOS response-associated peptidase YedK